MSQTLSSLNSEEGPGVAPGPLPPFKLMTDDTFDLWMIDAAVGSSICYHEGFLPLDRPKYACFDRNPPTPEQSRVGWLAGRVYVAAERGWVSIYQKRLGANRYRYCATLLKKPSFLTRRRVGETVGA
jgi:hypothetical protein